MEKDHRDPIEMLFDDDCCDNIILIDEFGNETEFEQFALIPTDDKDYAVLHPTSAVEDIDEDVVLVFLVDADNDRLILEKDENVISHIYREFLKLLEGEE